MRVRYSKYDPEALRKLKDFSELLKLFNYLVLASSGDVEKVLRYMKMLQKQGYLDKDFNLDDFVNQMGEEGYLQKVKNRLSLTSKGERKIRQDSFRAIFSNLKKGGFGNHPIPREGGGVREQLPEKRPYEFGDETENIDFPASIKNLIRRAGLNSDFAFEEKDLEVFETESVSSCATVLLLDISHSMILYGEDRITPAKQVALALTELIMTRYPKDSLNVVLFGDNAKEVPIKELAYTSVGPFHTNTKAGLILARQILGRKKHPNKQIIMITDGKPSVIIRPNGTIYRNPVGLDPIIVNRTLDEAVICRKRKIPITTFMIASDPYLQNFVEKLTELNKGRAYFTTPDRLGEFILWDFVANRRKKIR